RTSDFENGGNELTADAVTACGGSDVEAFHLRHSLAERAQGHAADILPFALSQPETALGRRRVAPQRGDLRGEVLKAEGKVERRGVLLEELPRRCQLCFARGNNDVDHVGRARRTRNSTGRDSARVPPHSKIAWTVQCPGCTSTGAKCPS